jgi:thiol-disulfide isomerase/thioredoxin
MLGCTQSLGLRGTPGDVKTIASVGDRPLPVRSGAGDSSVRSGDPEPVVTSSTGRISGRVFDEQGKAVADARIRLAVGSEPGGKAVVATTDRSGAFTLRGLRPGSSYTVIAEYQGRNGPMTGRTEAEAPESNVRIGLHLRKQTSEDPQTSIRPARPKVEPISNVEEAEESEAEKPAPRFNREDLDPPAPEAEHVGSAVAAESRTSIARGNPRTKSSSGWTQTHGGAPATHRQRVPEGHELEPEDEEQNPLPPAIGSDQAGSTSEPARELEDPARLARAQAEPTDAATSDGLEPRPIPADVISGARTISQESYGPIGLNDPDAASAQVPNASPRRPTTQAPARSARRAAPSASPERPRPTWGELSFMKPSIPLDESVQKASRNLTIRTAPAEAPPSTAGGESALTAAPARSGPRPRAATTGPACQFDPAERRLQDFVLPDAQGRMTSFREFDSDMILLDFWGTWCAPCQKSVSHLVEIQQKLGGKKMQVIGIACEKSQPRDRSAKVAQAVQRLGINYPVLISTMDGTCPVQEAFQIQFYPTLVLLDRQGRILWREQGATDVTLARMDRFIARNLRLGRTREAGLPPTEVARSRD